MHTGGSEGGKEGGKERMQNCLVSPGNSLSPNRLDVGNEPWEPQADCLVMPQKMAEQEFKPDLNLATCFKARVWTEPALVQAGGLG